MRTIFTWRMRGLRIGIPVIVLCLTCSAVSVAQTRPETIRGRVTTDSGVAITAATVSATMAPDRTFQQATTDATGRFSIHFAAGTGDYLIHVSAVGYKTFRKRLTRAPSDTALGIDVKLAPEVTQLATVKVQAKKERPDRRGDPGADVGAAEQQREGVFASLAPDQEGNLAAIANAIPGATARADGLSVLGLGGSQSNTTLNGMAFGGTGLPRDADTQVRVATSTYDPSRGGFSGGQTSVELRPGWTYLRRRAHLTADAPPLQSTSAVGDRLGQRFTSLNGSIGGSGEWVENAWYYNSALQVSRRTADAASLLSVGSEALAVAGIAPDSAARLTRLLGAARLPLTGADIPGSTIGQTASFAARLDHAPYKPGTYDPSTETWNVSLFGNLADDQAQAMSPTALPTHGGRRTSLFAGTQLDYSRFFGDVLNDTRTALSVDRNRGTPYLRAPGGTVLVSSTLPGGDGARTGLAFGGNGALEYDRRSWTWETINETQWYTKGNPHRLKLTAESRLDGYSYSAPEDLLGSFSFASLTSLEMGQPSSFSRTLAAPSRTGGEWSGFLALGDYWRVTPSLQLLYGARLEGNRFTTSLADNPAVSSVFGLTTTHIPNTVHVSPRLGFTWYFGREPGGRGFRVSPVAMQTLWPTMMLRGGIGEFRGLLPPALLADASVATGLPGGVSRLTCIGAATPTPQWADYLTDSGTIPTTCANGAPSAFSDAAPSVRLFDPSFDAPRSWRANLTWMRTIGDVGVMVDGVYSLNLNQPGTVDLNFSGAQRFTLADEGNRPVFVGPASIVPATGALSPVDARLNGAFGRVVSHQSDLRSTSRQITATLTSQQFGRVYYGLSYTLGDVRADARGFDGATFGAPSRLERAPGDFDVRHQVIASVGTSLPYGMNVALYGRFMSGLPYTPRVAGDVNGDGLGNDRAFVFDPSQVADAQLANGMRSLLDAAPSQARECLLQQLGRPAERNSCRGPWTATLNARIGLISRYGYTRRSFEAVLHISNPLGGLDQLLHGADHLQGWGGGALPDPTLLMVRGFDPATPRFRYEVNPRFGSTRSTQQLSRIPFRITLDLTFDLGVPVVKQQALKLLNPGRRGHAGPRLSADSMVTRLKRQVPDLYDAIMRESDSLLISREQVDSLKAAQVGYRARIDSLWKATTSTLAAMSDDYDANAAMYLIDDATERAWLIGRDELPVLEKILSPLQMRLAPWMVSSLKQSIGKDKVGVRMFMF
jgi:hypothetical protein